MNHQILPHDPEAERGLLCSFLLAPREVGNLCAERRLAPEAFHLPAHAIIFRHLLALWTESAGIDTITVTDRLRAAGELLQVGGAANVSGIGMMHPSPVLAGDYLEIVQSKAVMREIHATCCRFSALALSGEDSAADTLLAAQNSLAGICAQPRAQSKPFRTLLLETVDSIERGDDATADILSGIDTLDAIVRMRRGNVIVISGEAKSGKTALAGSILAHASVHQDKRCAVFSLEMSDVEMVKRAISCVGRVNLSLVTRPPSGFDMQAIERGVNALKDTDLEIVADTFDLGGIVARCRQLHAKRPLDLIVLDYIQLVEFSTGRKGETRQEIVAQISRTCKRVAGELQCVVIALSQLNEEGKLRESRAIGQDANAVLAVENDDEGGKKIRVVAQRSGASNVTASVRWIPQFTRFENP